MLTQEDAARALSLEIVSDLAPEEREFFNQVWRESADPSARSSRVDPLSFGVNESISLITPIVIQIVVPIIEMVWSEAKVAVAGVTRDYFVFLRERLRKAQEAKDVGAERLPAPRPEQQELSVALLERIRALSQAVATKEGVDLELAESISLKIVARLVLPQA